MCQHKGKMTGNWIHCKNLSCKKKFYRAKNDISENNYCCRACAAIVNNVKYPKRSHSLLKICRHCSKRFKGSSNYCSLQCGKASRFKYNRPELIKLIQTYYEKLGRVPAKREAKDMYRSAEVQFGSWNQAIVAAGLTPNKSHSDRMYKRMRVRAEDGHLCDSISEVLVDNWLARNGIPHQRDIIYPKSHYKADWGIDNDKIFIEYFGLAGDSPRYDRSMEIKRKFCQEARIKLIEIYPKDLYPKINLSDKLKTLL